MNSKMFSLILFASAMSASLALAGTSCSNKSSTLKYEEWAKEGGAAPFPGLIIGERTWTYKGQVLAQSQIHYLTQDTPMDIEAAVVPGTYVVLSTEEDHFEKKVTYRETVTLTRKSGQAVYPDSDAMKVKETLFCTHVVNKIPIP